jgi:hypothetical protein
MVYRLSNTLPRICHTSAMGSEATPQARLLFKDAFSRFEETLSFDDKRDFDSTTLQDVRIAARDIEKQLAARQSLRNMRRLEPFLAGLEHYSKVVEVLCNGTPYLPYIWVSRVVMISRGDICTYQH